MSHQRKTLSGWGRYPVVDASVLTLRSTPDAVANLLDTSDSVIARGMARSYGDASLPTASGRAVKTRWLDRFIAFDPETGILTAEAGVTLESIVDVAVPAGWFLPVSPGTRFVSLGGAIASNIHGKNHHKVGAIVRFVEELEVLTGKGRVRCSPSCNAPLFFATVGGYGLTGLILSATIRLRKIETTSIAARFIKVASLEEALAIDLSVSEDYEYSVTWLDALAPKQNLGRGIVMLGNHARRDELPVSCQARPLRHRWARAFGPPDMIPGWLLNPFTNRIFNTAYGNRFLGREASSLVGLESWFYPLDRVSDWNRFYGKTGFVEFQCSLPTDSAGAGMRALLSRIQVAGTGSFLAVYKRMGHDAVTMPFAIPGFTLAIDFGLQQPRVLTLIAELERIVIEHGGRVYLSKDASMGPETFRRMYPEYAEWSNVVAEWAPGKLFRSRMSDRLAL